MAMEERQGINFIFVPLKEIDLQKAFDVGTELCAKTGCILNGINVFTFAGNPPTYKQSVNIFGDPKHIGTLTKGLSDALGLKALEYIVQAIPASQFVPRTRPPQTAG